MSTGEIIISVIVFVIAGVMFLLGIRHLRERGFLLNNAWLYASKEQRDAMDKKPYYRQSGIVFCLLGLVFAVIGLSVVLRNSGLLWPEAALVTGTVIYAVASSARIEKKK